MHIKLPKESQGVDYLLCSIQHNITHFSGGLHHTNDIEIKKTTHHITVLSTTLQF